MEERRQLPRSAFLADVQARVGGRRLSLFVYDLSMDGCMIQTSNLAIVEGQAIILELDAQCAAIGTVIWRKNLTAGMQFKSRLNPAVVKRLVEAARQSPYAQTPVPQVDRSVLRADHRKVDPPRSERVPRLPKR